MVTELHQLPLQEIFWLIFGALLIGIEKAGIKGLSMGSVTIFALILGGKASSGLLLLLFMLADLFAVRHYYHYAQTKVIRRLILPAIIGVLAGAILGNIVDDQLFKNIISIVILSCLLLMLFPQFSLSTNTAANYQLVTGFIGFLTGFSTMIANVSSPILAIYLLALQLPKKQFIGTIVWFFFIVNFFKLPFHIWSWKTIQWSTLSWALMTIPIIGLGFLMGLLIIRQIPERRFRQLIFSVTLIASLKLLFS